MDKRVTYYGMNNLTNTEHLNKAVKIMDNGGYKIENIIDAIEFYNIYLYIDNGIYFKAWTKEDIERYTNKSEELYKQFKEYISKRTGEELIEGFYSFGKLLKYHENLFYIIDKFNLYKKINKDAFLLLLEDKQYYINEILKYKGLVKYFENEIHAFLLKYRKSTELLLKSVREKNIFLPSTLTIIEKNKIINDFIENNEEGFKDIEYISNSNDKIIGIDAKTKLKAIKKHKELTNKIFENNGSLKVGFNLLITPDQKEDIVTEKIDSSILKYSYSKEKIDSYDFKAEGLAIFTELFGYINNVGLIDLVSKYSESSALEQVITPNHNNYYNTNYTFRNKEMLSDAQFSIIEKYLKDKKGFGVETLINNFVENELSKVPGLENLSIKLEGNGDITKSSLRDIHTFIDELLKQYNCFVNEGHIDHELINMESNSLKYNQIPSLLETKYFYLVEGKVDGLIHHLFSDQSILSYVKGYEGKYKYFYDLINNENIKKDLYKNNSLNIINDLISSGYLQETDEGYIKIKDKTGIYLLSIIHLKGVIPYYSISDIFKQRALKFEEDGILVRTNTLLTRDEASYFNYYFNNSEFINGLEIRNKAVHGYVYEDNELVSHYNISLKLLVILLTKIYLDTIVKI